MAEHSQPEEISLTEHDKRMIVEALRKYLTSPKFCRELLSEAMRSAERMLSEQREAAIRRETAMECAKLVCYWCGDGDVPINKGFGHWHEKGGLLGNGPTLCRSGFIRERFHLDEQPKPEGSDA